MFNPGPPFVLRVRVKDTGPYDWRTGFNDEVYVEPGANEFRIALEEIRVGPVLGSLDPTRIRKLALYNGRDQPARTYFIDNVRLEAD